MAKIAIDMPRYMLDLLNNVDFDKISGAQYDAWMRLIKDEIGKHLKARKKPVVARDYSWNIRQDFCDLLNRYDFNLPVLKRTLVVSYAKTWANKNLPLKRRF